MERRSLAGKYGNCIGVLLIVLLNAIAMGVFFDFYYDLNDDTMMKDIMSGRYSGTPDGHNMQTLYPLGVFLSLLYRLCGGIPWYGLFLFLCQFGCLYLVGLRLAAGARTVQAEGRGKAGACAGLVTAAVGLTLFSWGVFLPHMINVQYTITCAMLSATAIFWFLTTPRREGVRAFLTGSIPAVLLVLLANQLRTEMLLLTLPFVACAGFFCWTEEEKFFSKENLLKYGSVAGVIAAGILLLTALDSAAYAGEEWKDFRRFFEERTTIYDFYPEIITQDAYQAELSDIGISEARQELLRNYNFGLDEGIDTELLAQVSSLAQDSIGAQRSWPAILREQLWAYRYRFTHSQDAPYNLLVVWTAAAVLITGVRYGMRYREKPVWKRYAAVWQLALLFLMRTAIWLFILARGRYPERITHSLYLVEFTLLAGMLLRQRAHGIAGEETGKNVYGSILRGMTLILLVIPLLNLADSVAQVRLDQERRQSVNRQWQEIDDYCTQYADHFYFEDVYSTVSFSEKLLADPSGWNRTERKIHDRGANYDILGGWMCKSPLYREKLAGYGIEQAGDALLKGSAYLIVSDAEAQDGLNWLLDYYEEQGVTAVVVCEDRIGDHYGVYRVDRSADHG